jgi:hypothetical protein
MKKNCFLGYHLILRWSLIRMLCSFTCPPYWNAVQIHMSTILECCTDSHVHLVGMLYIFTYIHLIGMLYRFMSTILECCTDSHISTIFHIEMLYIHSLSIFCHQSTQRSADADASVTKSGSTDCTNRCDVSLVWSTLRNSLMISGSSLYRYIKVGYTCYFTKKNGVCGVIF